MQTNSQLFSQMKPQIVALVREILGGGASAGSVAGGSGHQCHNLRLHLAKQLTIRLHNRSILIYPVSVPSLTRGGLGWGFFVPSPFGEGQGGACTHNVLLSPQAPLPRISPLPYQGRARVGSLGATPPAPVPTNPRRPGSQYSQSAHPPRHTLPPSQSACPSPAHPPRWWG